MGIRPIVGTRMPMNAYAQQGSPQEGGYGGHTPPQYHAYHMQTQNNMPFTSSYGNPNYLPRGGGSGYPPVYVVPQNVVPQSGGYGNNVVIAPQPSQGHQQQQAQQQQQQQAQQQQQQPQQTEKKRPTIKLTDPNTGKDLTSEILTKKNSKTNPKPAVNPDESIKAKTAALFAAQVAKKIAGSTPPPTAEKTEDQPEGVEKAEEEPAQQLSGNKSTPVLSQAPANASVESSTEQLAEKSTKDPAPLTPSEASKEEPTVAVAAPATKTVEVVPKVVKSEAEAVVMTEEKGPKDAEVPAASPPENASEESAEGYVVVEPVKDEPEVSEPAEVKEDTDGVKVEPIYKVDGKIRPICKVEDEMLKNDVKLAAELVDKMNSLEVKESQAATAEETKVEPSPAAQDGASAEEPADVKSVKETSSEKVVEEPIEMVDTATTESIPDVVDDNATPLEKEIVNEEPAKKENKNVKIEKTEEVNAPI